MKICFISKYPPIEGGESSKAYWLIKGLGEEGHEVHIITNAWEVEKEYREKIETDDLELYHPKNVYVHNTDPFINPEFIPYTIPYTEKISSLALDVIKERDLQLVDSWYLIPYGVSGFIVKKLLNKPQILRHAGSDITRLFSSPYLNSMFIELFKNADKIVTYPTKKNMFLSLGIPEHKIHLNNISVNTEYFHSNVKPFNLLEKESTKIDSTPIITYIGKIGITKGIFDLADALSLIKDDFRFLVCAGGKDLQRFKEYIKKRKLENKTIFLNFVPPWKIPSIIKLSTCVVIPERNFPVLGHSPMLPREVMCVGKCTLLSEEIFNKCIYPELEPNLHTIIVDPVNIKEFSSKLHKIIKNPDFAETIGINSKNIAEKHEDFKGYIKNTEELYKNTLEMFETAL